MNTSEVNKVTKGEVKKLGEFFIELMGGDSKYEVYEWPNQLCPLIKKSNLTSDGFKDFLTWATQENVSEIGGMNSVKFLAAAKDPMVSLVKNFDSLFRVYQANRKSKSVMDRKSIALPLPTVVVQWLMVGRGVNAPAGGYTSYREKLDAIKCLWYGLGWENQPDPEGDYEKWFNAGIKENREL